MGDVVRAYLDMDLVPFLEGCEKLDEMYSAVMSTPTNLFRDHVSLPGLSTRLMSDHLCAQKWRG